jgi:hypothetical protein
VRHGGYNVVHVFFFLKYSKEFCGSCVHKGLNFLFCPGLLKIQDQPLWRGGVTGEWAALPDLGATPSLALTTKLSPPSGHGAPRSPSPTVVVDPSPVPVALVVLTRAAGAGAGWYSRAADCRRLPPIGRNRPA